MSLDKDARRCFGVTYSTLVNRIDRVWLKATPSDVEAGARWYDEAGDLATSLADAAGSRARAASVIAHLSPRSTWARNVLAADALIRTGKILPGVMGREARRAEDALNATDPLQTFTGPKTYRFALNILGDREAVTVDVWACRVAGVDEDHLTRKGAYDVLEAAYRAAARRRGVDPATMQATTWIVARGGRAA